MKLAAILVFCSLAAFGQQNNARPMLVQSNDLGLVNGCSPCTVIFLDGVTANNVIQVGLNWGTGSQTIGITDSLSSTYSLGSLHSLSDSGGTAFVQTACAVIPLSGSDTLTITGITTNTDVHIAEFSGVGTCGADGTSTANANTVSFQSSLTTTPTTANSNDFCLTWAGDWSASSELYSAGQIAGGDGSNKANLMDFRIVGASGSQSITINANNFSRPSLAWIATSTCYQTPLAIATTFIPDGAQSVVYAAQLVTTGGSGSSRTWSISAGSLPTGLSLNGSTGAITGTPTGSTGTSSFTVKMTDGTNTVLSPLSITIGATFATPAVAAHAQLAQGPITYSATAGHVLVLAIWGQENSGSHIWTPRTNGSSNYFVTIPQLLFTRLYPLAGVPGSNGSGNGAPLSVYAACIPSTTTQSINFIKTNSAGGSPSNAEMSLIELSGVQLAPDDGATGTIAGASGSSLSVTANGSTQVANEMVVAFGTEGVAQAPVINSPFTQLDSIATGGVDMVSGNDLIAAAGSYSATMANGITGSQHDDVMTVDSIPFRAEITGVGCTAPVIPPTFSFEKVRRQIW